MTTQKDIDAVLRKVAGAEKERLCSYSVLFENVFRGEEPEETWVDISEEEASAYRAALRMGYLIETYVPWTYQYEDNFMPDGGDHIVSLSGLGTERLIKINEPWYRSAFTEVRRNSVTIVVSVLISVTSAWLLYAVGPDEATSPNDTVSENTVSH